MYVRGVWGVYEWLWILGGGMMCKQLINTQFDYFILAGSFSSSYLGLVKMYRLSGCLQGVWRVSGRRLKLSEWLWILSGGYDVQAIDKHPIWHIFISLFLFSQLPKIGQNVPYFGVSGGCLEGVWEASGVVWVTLDTVWGDMMCKQLINTQFDSSSLAYSFSPSCLRLVKTCHILGCL